MGAAWEYMGVVWGPYCMLKKIFAWQIQRHTIWNMMFIHQYTHRNNEAHTVKPQESQNLCNLLGCFFWKVFNIVFHPHNRNNINTNDIPQNQFFQKLLISPNASGSQIKDASPSWAPHQICGELLYLAPGCSPKKTWPKLYDFMNPRRYQDIGWYRMI